MYSICETTAAITTHLRWIGPNDKPNYNGSTGDLLTLCGMRVGWDLEFDKRAQCRKCIEMFEEEQ